MLQNLHEIDADAYHRLDHVSNGMLQSMAKSPYHCWAEHLNPLRPSRPEPAPAMRAGTLAHCAILEPHALHDRYVVKPDGLDARTKDGKAWLADQQREVITVEQMAVAKLQQMAVLAVPELKHALSAGAPEMTGLWMDSATGIHCRCRPDWIHPLQDGRVIVVDLKTTSDASPDSFARAVANFGYHRQQAHYTAGLEAAGLEVAAFLFAVVTSTYPFVAVPYVLDDESADRGRTHWRELLDRYAECKASNTWPAYGEGVQTLSLPAWAMR